MTEPTEQPPDLDAARLRLDTAVQQLVQPTTEHIARDRPEHHPDVADVQREHDHEIARLKRRLTDQRSRLGTGTEWQQARTTDAVTHTRRRIAHLEEQAQQRRVQQAQLPSLLDQLQAAVESTTGSNGAAGARAYRSAIGFAAAELVADMQHAVRWGNLAHPDKPLADTLHQQLRDWAGRAGHWQTERPAYLLAAAHDAERWVTQARALLNPPRTFGLVGACPHCGRRTAHIRDDTGEYVRRDALQVSYTDEVARCVVPGCGASWPREKWGLLGGAIAHDRDQQAG